MTAKTIPTPIGPLGLIAEDEYLVEILFAGLSPGTEESDSPVLRLAEEQLSEYFAGTRRDFSIPLKFKGTNFQRAVWMELQKIPYGKTKSYADVATAVGNPKAVRAVGGANHANRLPIVIPCHRVIGKNGKLVGFGGGLPTKTFLLEWERNHDADHS